MSLQEMRAKLQAAKQQSTNNSTNSEGSSELFKHWDMPMDTSTVLRFIKDADESNPYFWREIQKINIKFDSVEGNPEMGSVEIKVPCVRMYNHRNVCPIVSTINKWWKTDKEDLARSYWPKKSYLYQGFVIQSEIDETTPPENLIRRFMISKQIHKIIEESILDEDMTNEPYDYNNGTNFRIKKSKGAGGYADYNTSGFVRNESALNEEQMAAIETYGHYDLKTYMPNEPTPEQLEIIREMFEESLKPNSQYKLRWASYIKPFNLKVDATSSTSSSSDESSSDESQSDDSAGNAPASVDAALASLRAKIRGASSH